jgi:hypothetical protein
MNAEARVAPGEKKVDALGSDELSVTKKSENLVAEEELGVMGVDVRDGMPRAVLEENPSGHDGMNVRIPLQRGPKGLEDGDHSGPGLGLFDRCDHHLVNGFESEPGELRKELSMVEEVGPEHLG